MSSDEFRLVCWVLHVLCSCSGVYNCSGVYYGELLLGATLFIQVPLLGILLDLLVLQIERKEIWDFIQDY